MSARHTAMAGQVSTPRANVLTGTLALARFVLRRDRIRLSVWVVGIAVLLVAVAQSYADTFPSQDALNDRADLVDSPVFVAFNGPGYGLEHYTLGVMVANESLYLGVILVALMSILLVTRHTRAEEEAGRSELIRSAVVGRHAALAASVLVVALANVAVGILTTGALATSLEELDATGSLAFGLSMTAGGLVFTGVAAMTAQVTTYGRGAAGLGVAVLALTYVVRAVGDVSESWLSWLSPFAWSLATRPYVDERWWPLALSLVLSVALVTAAAAASVRRDVGAGLVPPRPGPATAAGRLLHPAGVAARQQRAAVWAWAVGALVLGASFGSLVSDVEEFAADNEQIQEILAAVDGVTLVDSFLAAITLMLVLIATACAIQSTMRMRQEELGRRAEPVLATAVSRTRWAGSYVGVAMAVSAVVITAGVAGLGATAAASRREWSLLFDVLAGGFVHIPAVWLVIGVAAALFGYLPRAMPVVWLVLGYGAVLGLLGGALGAPDSMRDISPFEHVPAIAGDAFDALPVLVLALLAAVLVAAGLAGFRRRDVAT